MRSTYLMAGVIVLALVAAGVLFATNFFQSVPLVLSGSEEAALVKNMSDRVAGVGFARTFTQKDMKDWHLTGGHRLERLAIDRSGTVSARFYSSVPLDTTQFLEGLYLELPAEFRQASNGRKIEIGIVARATSARGSDAFSTIYLTRQAGNSGWRRYPVSSRFELQTFTFNVPRVEAGYLENPFLVIHADASGQGRGIELLGAYVKILPAAGH